MAKFKRHLPAAFTDSEFTFGVEQGRGALHHRRVCLKRESLEVLTALKGFKVRR